MDLEAIKPWIVFVMFWAVLFFIVLGGVIGLIGIWINDFWNNWVAVRLLWTDVILGGTAMVVALITKWFF